MRAYKFLDERFGLKSLYERRLKQSRIRELNDPFELAPYDLTNPELRRSFLSMREHFDREIGLVCFSGSWQDPVIWAHYADQHRGLCLGFEVPRITGDGDRDIAKKVKYISRPWKFPDGFLHLPLAEKLELVHPIAFTKFKHWAYEREIRIFGKLSNEEDGRHYFEFEDRMRLVEVRIGARCAVSRTTIERALGSLASEVKIVKVRPAYDRFKMVEDKN